MTTKPEHPFGAILNTTVLVTNAHLPADGRDRVRRERHRVPGTGHPDGVTSRPENPSFQGAVGPGRVRTLFERSPCRRQAGPPEHSRAPRFRSGRRSLLHGHGIHRRPDVAGLVRGPQRSAGSVPPSRANPPGRFTRRGARARSRRVAVRPRGTPIRPERYAIPWPGSGGLGPDLVSTRGKWFFPLAPTSTNCGTPNNRALDS